jgi:hypothetical protein
MFKFLREDSKVSSLRVTLFLGTLGICALIGAICVYMTIHAIKCTDIDWSGMAVFLGAVSAFAGTLLYGKVQQKKVENAKNTPSNNPTPNTPTDNSNLS